MGGFGQLTATTIAILITSLSIVINKTIYLVGNDFIF